MLHARATRCALLLIIVTLIPILSVALIPGVHADTPFSLTAVPAYAQEGTVISLTLTANSATGGTRYQFVFLVKDPAGTTFQSPPENYTTLPGQTQFTIRVLYPSATFPGGATSLVGQYVASVDVVGSILTQVAQNSFYIGLADSPAYERTQTVNVQGAGYSPSESVTVTIKAQTSSTIVFSQTVTATTGGMVTASWKVPRNATIDNYAITLAGTTIKNPADSQTVSIRAATMSIPAISTQQSTYQRTNIMQFSFQPTYPDGSIASTGVALLALARPDGSNITLTATYDNVSQAFEASYQTARDNETGTWTAVLTGHAYGDAYGNSGPGTRVSTNLPLTPATLTVNVDTGTSFTVGQQLKFNASITYPDGTTLQSGGAVGAYLMFSGSQTPNETVPVVFDTALNLWIGTYTWQAKDTGGLWSLVIRAADSSAPANTGFATRAINLQNNTPSGNVSFPLYYFGILAAIIAAMLVAGFLYFRRHRVTHANLKIDLEAVKTEAGRIENQEFFQSVKDQVKDQVRKDKDEQV